MSLKEQADACLVVVAWSIVLMTERGVHLKYIQGWYYLPQTYVVLVEYGRMVQQGYKMDEKRYNCQDNLTEQTNLTDQFAVDCLTAKRYC